MCSSDFAIDPWTQTIGLLKILSSFARDQRDKAAALNRNPVPRTHCSREASKQPAFPVKILDRPDRNTVTVAWCDPTLCHYGDQIWEAGIAKSTGVCAISGMCIERGDEIYKPRSARKRPLNANAMILCSAVGDVVSC
ncbi:DUF3331 domain-containing protein [Burkholderia ubonensis]|uniref:DUF3331 domain-containing protein n=1 Tax=Burkholderia ubonensis TaxID=101571 RepID=UPI0009B3486C|nr:DUF3331 domain-containing protein [Burkholderia ubonensis]